MKQYLLVTMISLLVILSALFIISGCSLGNKVVPTYDISQAPQDIKEVQEKNVKVRPNFDLHIFSGQRAEPIPCYYWTVGDNRPNNN